MARINYCISPLRILDKSAFKEASKEELRVLLGLIELSGEAESAELLSEAVSVSVARCKAALSFWEESGVIVRRFGDGPTLAEEFDDRLLSGEIDEVSAVSVANSIRNENLSAMIDEVATLMGQACLPNVDVKNLTALYTQYLLSPEFVATLAAHLACKGALTVRRLCNEAIRLHGTGCDSIESLESYIKNKEEGSAAEWEFRRILGIYGRNLSQSEKNYFKKWSEEYGYSVAVVSEAYDIAVLNTKSGRGDLRYMDSILSDWHSAGCRTVGECLEKLEADKAKKTAEGAAKSEGRPKRPSKTTPETPRYGEFDINDAFKKAMSRSYGDDENQ